MFHISNLLNFKVTDLQSAPALQLWRTSFFLDFMDSWETVRNPKSSSFPELLFLVE